VRTRKVALEHQEGSEPKAVHGIHTALHTITHTFHQDPRDSPDPRPPGEFVSEDLASDCARFLEDLKQKIAAREAGSDHAVELR
jgi:hypothetical protein